jgi:Sulfatase
LSQRGLSWNVQHFNRWLVDQEYQRHLLQVGFTDRLLGRALDRLRATGLYDRSLVVVTADNGEGFGRLGNGHEISRRNAGDIALSPLFVKPPFQREGRIERRHVRTIDVLPTIAAVAHLRIDWPIEGRSVLGRAARRIPSSTLLVKRSGQRLRLSLGALRSRAADALRLKLRLFGSGAGAPGLYGIGPFPSMHGAPVGRFGRLPASGTRAALDAAGSYSRVRLGSGFLPVMVTGTLTGSDYRRPLDIAVAVNDTIAATAPTFAGRRRGRQLFSALLPETALRDGANRVQLFAIVPGGTGPRLRPLTP